MSLERNRFGSDGEISFECDDCGVEHHSDTADFRDALHSMKSEGWLNVRDGRGDWNHYCGDACMQSAKRATEKRI